MFSMVSFSSSSKGHRSSRINAFLVTVTVFAFSCAGLSIAQARDAFLSSRLISFSSLLPRATFAGFPLNAVNSLQGIGLEAACEQVLYQPVNCDNIVSTLGGRVYHNGWNDSAVMTSICAPSCEASLKTIRRRVAGACAKTSEIMPGYPTLAFVDSIYTGWNETCLRDDKTEKYCNGMRLLSSLELI